MGVVEGRGGEEAGKGGLRCDGGRDRCDGVGWGGMGRGCGSERS